MHTHLTGDVGQNLVARLKLDPEHGIGERFDDRSFEDDGVFLGLGQNSSS